jgi:hypothetical protein
MANELICKIVSSPRYKANFKTFKEKKIICKPIVWVNTNKLLERNNSVVGIKTGITPKAGGCLATFYKIDEKNFVYMGTKNPSSIPNLPLPSALIFGDWHEIRDFTDGMNDLFNLKGKLKIKSIEVCDEDCYGYVGVFYTGKKPNQETINKLCLRLKE